MSARTESRILFTLLAALVGVGAAQAHPFVPGAAQSRPILLQGGDLYTVSHGVLPATDLLFEGGKIVAIGPGLAAPAGAQVFDVRGKRVYPGLIAAATQLGLTEIGAVRATSDYDETGAISPEAWAGTAFNSDSELIPVARRHGVTTAQVAPSGGLLPGRSGIFQLDGWTREDAAVRAVDGVYLSWPGVSVFNLSLLPPAEEQRKQIAEANALLERAFTEARAYHLARTAGETGTTDLRWEAMRPLFRGEIPLFVEADDPRQIEAAVAFCRKQGVRMVLVGGRESHLVASVLREAKVPVLLPPTTEVAYRDDDAYDHAYRLPALLHEAGVSFALSYTGGSAWDVRNLPFQAGIAAGFGLPKEVALRSITLSAAEILGIADRQGSLEVGKSATLFVSDGDVLDPLTQRVTRVFIEGRAVDLDNRHEQLYRKYRVKIGE
ncbi:MAG TPA: amidohydrolase family protein [Thermoanaerobaculia bacterium]|nr:amidohydrolase family protein [Thermoanaerobaculia bacterium]